MTSVRKVTCPPGIFFMEPKTKWVEGEIKRRVAVAETECSREAV